MLRLRGLSRTFVEGDRRHVVLDGLDLEVGRGQTVAILGPSGSGKSTLLNLISGIDDPDQGTVEVAGLRLDELGEHGRTLFRRRHIGFIFQFFNLLPTLTVQENLLLPLELNRREGAEDRVRELLERVGLSDRAGSYPDRLSGGEQQRVAIARALAHEPELILADEPTGNLDRETGARVLGLLDDLVRAPGRTMLVVTHSPDVLELADRALVLRDGRLEPARTD